MLQKSSSCCLIHWRTYRRKIILNLLEKKADTANKKQDMPCRLLGVLSCQDHDGYNRSPINFNSLKMTFW